MTVQSKISRVEIPSNLPASKFLFDLPSSVPVVAKGTKRSHALFELSHMKETNRCRAVFDQFIYLSSRPPCDLESCQSNGVSRPERQCSTSPASSVSSGKSVRITDSDDYIRPGRYSAYGSKPSPKGVLKPFTLVTPSNENSPSLTPSQAIDNVLRTLVTTVKSFKCPSELDFPAVVSEEHKLLLPDTEMNRPFIEQLRRLDALRVQLNQIETYTDEQKQKHRNACVAIGRALQRMKEHQLKLLEKHTKAR